MTASISAAVRPAFSKAFVAALTAISAMTDNSSSPRAGRTGCIISGSSTPDLLSTWRRSMPEALRMNSSEDMASGSIVPAAMAAAFASFWFAAHALKAATSSALEMVCSGVKTPVPLMTALCISPCSRVILRRPEE